MGAELALDNRALSLTAEQFNSCYAAMHDNDLHCIKLDIG